MTHQESQIGVVYLGWPIAPSYVSPNARGGCGVSSNEHSCAHGAQINFGDLPPLPMMTHRLRNFFKWQRKNLNKNKIAIKMRSTGMRYLELGSLVFHWRKERAWRWRWWAWWSRRPASLSENPPTFSDRRRNVSTRPKRTLTLLILKTSV